MQLQRIWSDLIHTSKIVTPEDELCLARISAGLEAPHEVNIGRLETDLFYLSKRAAGKFHVDIANYNKGHEGDNPNNLLAKAWQGAFNQYLVTDPISAVKLAYKTSLQIGGGCRIGVMAREAVYNNIEAWALEDYLGAMGALKSTVFSSLSLDSQSELVITGVNTFVSVCEFKDKQYSYATAEQLQSLYGLISVYYKDAPNKGEKVLGKIASKLLDSLDHLDGTKEVKASTIFMTVSDWYFKHEQDQGQKNKFALCLSNYTDVETNQSFEKAYNDIKALVPRDVDRDEALWLLSSRALDAIYKNSSETNPADIHKFIAKYMLSYAQKDHEKYKDLSEYLEKTVDHMAEKNRQGAISCWQEIATKVDPSSSLYKKALTKMSIYTQKLVESESLAACNAMIFIASHADPYSSMQEESIKLTYKYIDALLIYDREAALKCSRNFVSLAQKIDKQRKKNIAPFFKIERPLSDKDFQKSITTAIDFSQQAVDNPDIDTDSSKRFLALVEVSGDPSVKDAVSDMAKIVSSDELSSSVFQQALSKYFQIVDLAGSTQDKIKPLLDITIQCKRSYDVERPIAKSFFKLIAQTAKTSPKEAIDMLISSLNTLYKEDLRYSNLTYSTKEALPKYLSILVETEPELAKNYIHKLKKHEAFKSAYSLEPLWAVERKYKNLKASHKLAKSFNVDDQVVEGLGKSTNRLSWLYNKHAFYKLASDSITINQTGIGIWGFMAGAITGLIYSNSTEGSTWIPLLSGMGTLVGATIATAFASHKMDQSRLEFQNNLLKQQSKMIGQGSVSLKSQEQGSAKNEIPQQMKIADFIDRYPIAKKSKPSAP